MELMDYSDSTMNEKRKKHTGLIIFIVILIAAAIVGFGVVQNVKKAEYYSDMETISYTMLDGAAKAEDAGNLIKSVWHNAIFEERDSKTDKYTIENGEFVDDFNDALDNLFEDEEFINSISEIKDNQSEAADLMRKLTNPPKKYEEAYSILKIYYDNYLKMTNAVISPSGSLNTFSEDFNSYDSETVDSYQKMKLYLEP